MYTEFNSDGCPNNCAYCEARRMPCVYTPEGKRKDHTCYLCGKAISSDETYQYRGYEFCAKCLDKGRVQIEARRSQGLYDSIF